MTSPVETLAHIKSSYNGSNGKPGARQVSQPFVSQPCHTQESEQSSQLMERSERLAFLGTSAAVFAHELGNPLQAIFISLEFVEAELAKRQILDPFLTSSIQCAMREIERLRFLLREFRTLANPGRLHLQSADLGRIVEEVLALQKVGHQAAGIAVKLEYEKPLPSVMLDERKITQAVLNLCKNAAEAMPQGGCLAIRLYPSGSTMVMEIADNGIGVPEDVGIFELFRTTKPSGSGLGLPLVQQIVSAHKGSINYITQRGRGTTFTVSLPTENHR